MKTGVNVPVLCRLAELKIVPPIVASGEFEGVSFAIQEFIDAAYPQHLWFAEYLDDLAGLIRTFQEDPFLTGLLADQELTYLADDLEWVEKGFRLALETYGERALLESAYSRFLEHLPEMRVGRAVPTHGDLSRKNFLPAYARIYLVDWDQAALSDSMRDVGTLLWWYVPPARWPEFFRAYGSPLGDRVIPRACWWAAMASLEIVHGLLERGYRDQATDFVGDFLAAVNQDENPHARYAM